MLLCFGYYYYYYYYYYYHLSEDGDVLQGVVGLVVVTRRRKYSS